MDLRSYVFQNQPPPKNRRFLRILSVLVYGTGFRLGSIYPANILVVAVMVAGWGCSFASTTCGWYFHQLPKVKDFGTKAVAGLSFRWACDYIFLLIAAAAVAQTTLLIHRSACRSSFPFSGGPARYLIPHARKPSTQFGISMRRSWAWYVTNLFAFVSAVSGVINFAFLLRKAVYFHDPSYFEKNPFSHCYGPRTMAYVFSAWSVPLAGLWMAGFFATADDLVATCHEVKHRLRELRESHGYIQQEYVPLCRSQQECQVEEKDTAAAAYGLVLDTLEDLKSYIGMSLSMTKLWFSIHLILTFMGVLLFALSSFIFLCLSWSMKGKVRYPADYYLDVF